jgi:hypothetical protein
MARLANPPNFLARFRSAGLWAAYAATVLLFLWVCSHFHLQGKGFTYLVEFGSRMEPRYIPELRAARHYNLPDAYGYDGQYYAQIAMKPDLGDPSLRIAVDNLPYRARRILFCITAWAAGGGNPERALNIFAVQNIIAWLALSVVLLRWFPPTRWGNWFRWAGVLSSVGMAVSVRSSLMDGPSLLLIAGAMALLEEGRPWLSAALLGVSGLGRETNLLAAAALGIEGRRGALRTAGKAILVVLPLAAWFGYLSWKFGGAGGAAGARNFSLPFAGFGREWGQVLRGLGRDPWHLALGSLAAMVAVTVQGLFLVLRRDAADRWWRLGAAYAALMVVLGDAVWEGYPVAASRVLLPMILAFNILVPRGRKWWIVLALGNLSLVASPGVLAPPFRDSYYCETATGVAGPGDAAPFLDVDFERGWYAAERSWLEYWRWSSGGAVLVIDNPHPYAVTADLSFGLRAADRRVVTVRAAGSASWTGALEPGVLVPVSLPGLRIAPGRNSIEFGTVQPPAPPRNGDMRNLTFSLRNLRLRVVSRDAR